MAMDNKEDQRTLKIGSQSLLGQLLINNSLITHPQLEIALTRQSETRQLLGQILLDLNYIEDESRLLTVLSSQFQVPWIKLKATSILPEILKLIPAQFVAHYKVIPVRLDNGVLTVAMRNPGNIYTLDELGLVVPYPLKPVLAGEKDMDEAIRLYYGVGAETIEQMMGKTIQKGPLEDDVDDLEEIGSEASISKFLNQILLEAYKDRATDIHIEPFDRDLHVRYRVDGMMVDAKVPKNIWHFQDAIATRIKILSNLNIAEKRVPQDGRFKVRVGSVDLDMRVSFLPTPCGESIVLRLLNTTRLYDVQELGLPEKEHGILNQLMNKPNGIIFLTGPTGSGKTTTLYSCLSRLNTVIHKIITIEDPIEYQLKGITQVQINPGIGLTFAQGLRSMLRHDPDIMMVGEVRDTETATTAIQVALTGHLVFSTLHTNDAAGGIARLLDMGVEPYLITSTVQCFIAQRLVRILCDQCKKSVHLSKAMIEEMGSESALQPGETIFVPNGCEACHQTGFRGRDAIYEFLVLDENIQKLILQRANVNDIREEAVKKGMTTLRMAGWAKVIKGRTSLQEVVRVTQEGKT